MVVRWGESWGDDDTGVAEKAGLRPWAYTPPQSMGGGSMKVHLLALVAALSIGASYAKGG
jgi:hypothetical protein